MAIANEGCKNCSFFHFAILVRLTLGDSPHKNLAWRSFFFQYTVVAFQKKICYYLMTHFQVLLKYPCFVAIPKKQPNELFCYAIPYCRNGGKELFLFFRFGEMLILDELIIQFQILAANDSPKAAAATYSPKMTSPLTRRSTPTAAWPSWRRSCRPRSCPSSWATPGSALAPPGCSCSPSSSPAPTRPPSAGSWTGTRSWSQCTTATPSRPLPDSTTCEACSTTATTTWVTCSWPESPAWSGNEEWWNRQQIQWKEKCRKCQFAIN